MTKKAIQDYYADDIAICYGCGRHNEKGHQIKTYWDGREGLAHFKPKPHHTAFPGVAYGGLIASLIDCHCIGTAVAAAYEREGREPETEPEITYVTGSLKVTFLRPTPVGADLTLRAKITEVHKKRTEVACSVFADGTETAKGEVTVIRAPRNEKLMKK